ncbi:type II CAAX prenyl endopeptidase Rce1 family protein [Halomicroarcula sp. GCM10025710]
MGTPDRRLARRARWYVAAFGIPLLLITLTSIGLTVAGTSVDPGLLPGRVSLVLVSFVGIALVGGGNEEPGWRGLALPSSRNGSPPCQRRSSSAWSGRSGTSRCWRLAAPSSTGWRRSLLALTTAVRLLNIVGVAFVLTWIYNETGSVLLAILAHTGFNTANSTLVPLPLDVISTGDSTTILVVTTVAIWLLVAVLLVATRGRLGYDDETAQHR